MQSKRDQVQAHSFIMGRLTTGMLLAEPDAPDNPLSRTTRGVFIGLLVTVLIAAGSVVFGLISPGVNTSWQSSENLIINKNTGARYLYAGGRLRPVRNYASARLIGGADLTATSVSNSSLQDTAIGTPIGIPGAPDSVPSSDNLDSGPWLVCATDVPRTGRTDQSPTQTAVVIGAPKEGSAPQPGSGLVVSGPDKSSYLVWQGSRLRLDKASGATISLGYGTVTPQPVSAAFLDALVPGPVLASPEAPGLGTPGPQLNGEKTKIGQVFQVQVPGSAPQYYLLRREGLVPLTDTGAALALGDPRTRQKAYGGRSPQAGILGADTLKQRLAPGTVGHSPTAAGLPTAPPRAANVPEDSSLCAKVAPSGKGTQVSTVIVPTDSIGSPAQVAAEETTAACLQVDAVVVRPGHAALVRALGAAGTNVGDTTYLVGDSGAKYRIPSAKALESLGYAQSQVVPLPSPLFSMLPSGRDLNPDAAMGLVQPTTTPSGCATGTKGGTPTGAYIEATTAKTK